MRTALHHILILTLLALVLPARAVPADLARGLLLADGILSVKGGNVDEALITVIPADAPPYTLAKGTKRFELTFKLNRSYMVTFEHPQCLTKQLLFDTHVPDDYRFDEYTFPFEVVLEVETRVSKNKKKSYVGPVGYIRYVDRVNDFDYVTDYTIKIDERIQEQLDLRAEHTPGTPIEAAAERKPRETEAREIEEPAPKGRTSTTAPEPEPSDPNVVRVGGKTDRQKKIAPPAEPPLERDPVPATLTPLVAGPNIPDEEPPVPVAVQVIEAPVRIENTPEEAPPVRAVAKAIEKPADPAPRLPARGTAYKIERKDPAEFGRHEELIVEDNKVTTIVRIVNERGYYHEYRRIAHKFGPVFYFKDEESITEKMYRDDTGMAAE